MEGEVEYLSEWPVKPQTAKADCSIHLPEDSTSRDPTAAGGPAAKRRKQEETSTAVFQLESPSHDLTQEELSIARSGPSTLADTHLARWWKLKLRTRATSEIERKVPPSNNPNTLLYHIARLPEAKAFLQSRLSYLKDFLSEGSPAHHLAVASCYQKLGEYDEALKHVREATKADADNPETRWLHELLLRQERASKEIEERSRLLGRQSLPLQMPKAVEVERRHTNDLSFTEFFRCYALTHTPVIITGVVEHMTTSPPWTLEHIMKVIGHKIAPLKRQVKGSVEWAGLEPAGECSVGEFIESLDKPGDDPRYLFDWSLPLHCPELTRELRIPKYFASDFLQRTPQGALYHDSWPSLFIAPGGVCSGLHVDAFGSNFWMALFQGRKRWVFFPQEDTPCLYPHYEQSTDAIFPVDLSNPNLTAHPLLSLTHPRECVLEPGELLFVPSGCPHRVENLEKSLAISSNFVDLSNIEVVIAELRVNSILDERARQLLEIMEGEGLCRDMDELQETLEWNEFKTWPRAVHKPISVNSSSQSTNTFVLDS